MIGRNIAPGLNREFAAERWKRIPTDAWKQAREEARERGPQRLAAAGDPVRGDQHRLVGVVAHDLVGVTRGEGRQAVLEDLARARRQAPRRCWTNHSVAAPAAASKPAT